MSDKQILDWNNVYKEMKITEMPWYSPNLDSDLQIALDKRGLKSGTFVDLGTGPATQANRLSEKGFDVTGADISKEAIRLAKETYKNIDFIQDDILKTKLSQKYDFILDRGCFHVIAVDNREIYVKNVYNLLNDSGLLFLKCFSNKMPDTGFGPNRISEQMIKDSFEKYFIIEEIIDAEFKNEKSPQSPKALFVVMKRR